MTSKEKPKKLTIHASDGKRYNFLCKQERKGDLRKDARMMECAGLINRLLSKDTEGRRRSLRLRTYAVVCLNEECGLMQWVANTAGFRAEVGKCYASVGLQQPTTLIKIHRNAFERLQTEVMDDAERARRYRAEVLQPYFPAIFHKWFLMSFPDPASWLAARLTFTRSAAVWSMVGHIIGLGDRHGENLLLDKGTGECVHVDFGAYLLVPSLLHCSKSNSVCDSFLNQQPSPHLLLSCVYVFLHTTFHQPQLPADCLFDKGMGLTRPEVVPFRLSPNMLDGMGLAGYEGVFRRVSEVAMGVLRGNKEMLTSVLESFIHDPLVEWTRTKASSSNRPQGEAAASAAGGAGANGDVPATAMGAETENQDGLRIIKKIQERLDGMYNTGVEHLQRNNGANSSRYRDSVAKGGAHRLALNASGAGLAIPGQVDRLLKEATDDRNLALMYIGWLPIM